MKTCLQTHELTKIHKGVTIVDNVSITIKPGEIFGLVGPNGAGKTTLMKMIMNLVKPTHGDLDILGESVTPTSYKYLQNIGSIIETPRFMEDLTVLQNMEIHAQYYGYNNTSRIMDVLGRVGMATHKNLPVNRCSLGMKQRIAIARAILCEPKLLILDEPINGLDPAGMREIRLVLKRLAHEEGMSILVSSHILAELEQIIDAVAIMKNGTLIEQLTMNEIHARNLEYFVLETPDVQKALVYLTTTLNINNCAIVGERHIRIYEMSLSYQELFAKLAQGDFSVDGFEKEKKTLEDYFMSQTKRGSEDA
ncbi:ABC transporter ATP-binding protein [Erysipelothrix sp. HDW6C]|uniref:ABC transporter ATP-binding protein n=1 Tax=Erysipelothrix sp. HDW6C TaxID=2714930 RepID=UPI00140DAAAB|nr:ABC transporter ATP-binding protein [Erysipelothrix sp. HDW6C]QIK70800.1 ABC transporter ATP-binding protein [Erysipelothrix sp. HDW6C]